MLTTLHRVVQGTQLTAVGVVVIFQALLAKVGVGLDDAAQHQLTRPLTVGRQGLVGGGRRDKRVAVAVPAHPARKADRQSGLGVSSIHVVEGPPKLLLEGRKRLSDHRDVTQAALHLILHGGFQAAQLGGAPQRLNVRRDALHGGGGQRLDVMGHVYKVAAHGAPPHLGGVGGESQA